MNVQRAKAKSAEKLTEFVRQASRKAIRPGGGCLQTEAEIARALGESQRTVLNWRLKGIIPYVDAGFRSKRYRLDAVLEALNRRTIKPKK